jgi:cobalt-zinc-cadmium efflux system membrane fusion protein
MKALGLLGVPLLLAASAFAVLTPGPAPPADVVAADEPAPEAPVPEPLDVTDRAAPEDPRVVHVFSPVTGRLTKVHVRLWQRVKKGDPLATVEPPDFDPTSDVYKAQADLIAAQHDYKRKKELFTLGESRADFEVAADQLRDAKAKLAIAKEGARRLASLRVGFACPPYPCTFTLRSPVDGEVLVAGAEPGTFVLNQYAGALAPELFEIGQPDPWVPDPHPGW